MQIVGGRYEASPTAVTDGQVRSLQISTTGVLQTNATQSGTWNMRLQDGAGSAVNKGQSNMAGSLPVTIASDQTAIPIKPTNGTLTDRSGATSGTPSTSTQVAAANATRKYFILQNLDTTNAVWINFTTAAAATQPSIKLNPLDVFVMEAGFVSTEAINILSAVASVNFSAKEA
jgi:hypothetical protein